MKKKSIRLLLVIGILIVLVAAYFVVTRQNDEASTNTTESDTIKIVDRISTDLENFVLKGPDYEYKFIKVEGSWVLDNSDIAITSNTVQSISYNVTSITANRLIEENPTDLSIYGLDNPKVTITGEFNDGSNIVILLGSLAATGDAYYTKLADDSKVYTIGSYYGDNYLKKLSDIRPKGLAGFDPNQSVDYFALKGNDRQPIEVQINREADIIKELGISTFIMTAPYKRPRGVSGDAFNTDYLTPLSALSIKDFVDDSPTDLSKYGLDNPTLDIEIISPILGGGEEEVSDTSERAHIHLLFGSDADEDSIYFKEADKPNVYTMAKSSVQKYIDTKPFDLVDKFIALVNIEKVDDMTLIAGSEKFDIKIRRHTVPGEVKEDGTKDDDEIVTAYTINGIDIPEDKFKDFYKLAIGIVGDSEIPEEQIESISGTPEITLDYTINNGEPNISVKYIPYNTDFYVGGANDIYMYACNKKQVRDMLSAIRELVAE